MTIVDIMMHKWRMLDDRRRRIIIGSMLITVIVIVGFAYLLHSFSAKPAPTPTEPPTVAPSTIKPNLIGELTETPKSTSGQTANTNASVQNAGLPAN